MSAADVDAIKAHIDIKIGQLVDNEFKNLADRLGEIDDVTLEDGGVVNLSTVLRDALRASQKSLHNTRESAKKLGVPDDGTEHAIQ